MQNYFFYCYIFSLNIAKFFVAFYYQNFLNFYLSNM